MPPWVRQKGVDRRGNDGGLWLGGGGAGGGARAGSGGGGGFGGGVWGHFSSFDLKMKKISKRK